MFYNTYLYWTVWKWSHKKQLHFCLKDPEEVLYEKSVWRLREEERVEHNLNRCECSGFS